MVAIGLLKELVTIQTQSTTRNSYGEKQDSWSNTATVWARVEPIQGREFFEARQTASEVTHKVTIRQRTVLPTQRISWRTKTLDIQAVLQSEKRDQLVLMCSEQPSTGA